MVRNIFHFTNKTGSSQHLENAQVERDLAHIAMKLSNARWVALVKCNGLLYSIFPSHSEIGEDRISAMSAAMMSLGERIARELKDGEFQYTLIAGADGMTLMLGLSQDYVLTIGLSRDISVSTVFESLRESILPLLRTLQIENLPWL